MQIKRGRVNSFSGVCSVFSGFFLSCLELFFIFLSVPCLCPASEPAPLPVEQKAVRIARGLAFIKQSKIDMGLFEKIQAQKKANLSSLGRETEKMRAVVTFKNDLTAETVTRIKAFGLDIEHQERRRLQVSGPPPALAGLSHWSEVAFVASPIYARGQEIVSEAVYASGAASLQSQGVLGRGIRIGIIDLGFYGYDLLLGSELPDQVVRKNFRHDICGFSFCPSQRHGTAVAEIIHDFAPEAELYLVSVGTTGELLDAVNWLKEKNVDIVSCSLGYWLCGPIDGTGWCSQEMGSLKTSGILPIVAAGNSAMDHWFGPNKDDNDDSLVEIDEQGQSLSFSSYSFGEATVSANWNDWGQDPRYASSDQDIDLLVLSPLPGTNQVETVARGINSQSGKIGQEPIESVSFKTEPGRTYYIFLVNTKTTREVTVHVFVDGSQSYDLSPHKASQSVLQPADSPLVLTVGAADLFGNLLDFSSRGPTWDGRIKPDLTGFSGLETVSEGDFSGTSAAAPTVAGVAALLKDAHPDWGPDQLRAAVELLAKDIYISGQDNASGCGLIDVSRGADIVEDPEKGFWWNPERDGTGISIERKDGSDFLAIYTYRPDNPESLPTWLTANKKSYSGLTGPTPLLTWTGWPLGSPPTGFSSQQVAELSILYLKEGTGLLQIRDPKTNDIHAQSIERFVFSDGFSNADGRTGWWWDENLPGNGIFIEIQSGIVFGAWYHFGNNGQPRWWTFSGDLSQMKNDTLSADILEWRGGPCLTCQQQKPHPSVVGKLNLVFKKGEPSELDWQQAGGPSGSYHLSRFPF